MRLILNKIKRSYLLIVAGVLILANILSFAPQVFALTYLTKPEVILTNMNAAGNSALIITFTTSVSNAGTGVSLALPNFTVTGVQSYSQNYSGVTCKAITGATAYLPGAPAASGTGTTITFSGLTAFTSSVTQYCAVLTGTSVTNPAAGVYPGTLTAGTDQAATLGLDVITANANQVVVTASVPASFTLALTGGGTDPFSPLSLAVGSINSTTGITATMTTNGTGWVLYGYDLNAGLNSAATGKLLASTTPGTTATLSAGAEGYVTSINSTQTVVTAYYNAGFGTPGKGSGLNTNVVQLVSGAGPTASATATIKEYATISGATPAAVDYTDTITLLGAGTF